MKKILSFLLALWVVFACSASAQINQKLKEEFHGKEAHGYRIVESVSGLRAALKDEKVKVLCFQTFDETIEPAALQELFDWVRSGKTVWFYDARLAPLFGMKPMMLGGTEFRSKPEEGVLGGKKRQGLAAVALSLGSHPVQTGVGQVTIFLPELKGKGDKAPVEYGSIEPAGDTVPLLQFALDSPALVACRREGRGLIVFKSLLWNEPLSGDRFQLNLLEFSAGYQVPDLAGAGKVGHPPGPQAEYVEGSPAVPLDLTRTETAAGLEQASRVEVSSSTSSQAASVPEGDWRLELQDGSFLEGRLEMKMLEFETASSSLKLPPEQIKELIFGDSFRLDRMVTLNGNEQSGLLLTHPIKVRTARGLEEFEKEDLIKLTRSETK